MPDPQPDRRQLAMHEDYTRDCITAIRARTLRELLVIIKKALGRKG